jgi:hypothetical protein
MLARAEHEAAIRAGDSSDEEEELEVIDGNAPVASSAKGKGKGKAKATEVAAEPVVSGAGTKRRRPVVDPFAGESALTFVLQIAPSFFLSFFRPWIYFGAHIRNFMQDLETNQHQSQPRWK